MRVKGASGGPRYIFPNACKCIQFLKSFTSLSRNLFIIYILFGCPKHFMRNIIFSPILNQSWRWLAGRWVMRRWRVPLDLQFLLYYQCKNPSIIVRQHDQGASTSISSGCLSQNGTQKQHVWNLLRWLPGCRIHCHKAQVILLVVDLQPGPID